jgi:small subunit ribosomal protein S11
MRLTYPQGQGQADPPARRSRPAAFLFWTCNCAHVSIQESNIWHANPGRIKRRSRKNIYRAAVAHVYASFNNTMVTITDAQGNAHQLVQRRHDGLQGQPQVDALCRSGRRRRRGQEGRGAWRATLEVEVKGPGSGRESALRALQAVGFTITSIRDVTPIPHNGVRPSKRRRV